jgi:hypothetical protein
MVLATMPKRPMQEPHIYFLSLLISVVGTSTSIAWITPSNAAFAARASLCGTSTGTMQQAMGSTGGASCATAVLWAAQSSAATHGNVRQHDRRPDND